MAVFSVLCGYKLQECVHNHWSGLNVRVIKGTMEITSNATSPAASISWSMTFILRKLKDIPVPDVFGTICLHMIAVSELNNCNYCNCQIWDAVSWLFSLLGCCPRLLSSVLRACSSRPAGLVSAANWVCWWHKYSPAQTRSGIKLVQVCNYGLWCPLLLFLSLCIYQRTLKILSGGHFPSSKNRNKTGPNQLDTGSRGW